MVAKHSRSLFKEYLGRSNEGRLRCFGEYSSHFCKMSSFNLRFTARDSFKWMCFKKVFFSSCVSVRGIAMKWTSRLASDHGRQSLLRRAMSSMFSKYPSLLFEILLRNVQQNLQSGQLHPLPTSNGAEITTLLFAGIHSSQGISNLY